jgi:hypothetical protein
VALAGALVGSQSMARDGRPTSGRDEDDWNRCRHTHMVTNRIVEDGCSIHTAAKRRIWRVASATCSTTQRRARASRAILVRVRACSVARADTGRTQRPATSATAEQLCRRRASAYGAQATLSGCMNRKIRSFRTSLGHRGLFLQPKILNVSLAFSSQPRGVVARL